MPEGDTVYRTAHRLNDALAGQTLTRCDIRVPAYATVDLTGSRVDGVVSRGKHLLARVGEYSIHSHLKMEGSWELYREGERWRRPAYQARAILETPGHIAVGFQLGVLEIVPLSREHELVDYLGPDPLSEDWDPEEAERRLRMQPEQPVAVALLDQRNLAGLGNEYVNELCFLRGMLPTRPVEETEVSETVALAYRLMMANRDRVIRVTTGDARRGGTSWVHGREHQACRRCGTPIVRSVLGRTELQLRDTFYCPRCQR